MKTTLLATLCLLGFSASAFAAELISNEAISALVDKRVKVLDTSGDGKVSQEEFMAGSAKKFTDGDTSHDGFLSKDELLAMKMKEAKDLSAPAK